jgi:hypothetical protein
MVDMMTTTKGREMTHRVTFQKDGYAWEVSVRAGREASRSDVVALARELNNLSADWQAVRVRKARP